ncbi:hypothetical protein Ancab_008120 [Ancistrocladus abbreviatus]
MAFKTSVFFLALLAIALAISSEVTARDLAEKSHSEENVGEADVEDAKYYGNGENLRGEYGGYGDQGDHYYHYHHYRKHCHHGCCQYYRYRRGCCKCCPPPGKAAKTETENEP